MDLCHEIVKSQLLPFFLKNDIKSKMAVNLRKIYGGKESVSKKNRWHGVNYNELVINLPSTQKHHKTS